MQHWKAFFTHYRSLLIPVGLFLLLHSLRLRALPIFNDEAIYLDWGWLHLHLPNSAYNALLDAKAPLLIWVYGAFAYLFADPLLGGRLLSVMAGLIATVGTWLVAREMWPTQPQKALIAASLYAVTPLFVFYQRLAVMEASVMAVGVWTSWALVRLLKKPTLNQAMFLGFILGIGFFIKLTAAIFWVAAGMVFLIDCWQKKSLSTLQLGCVCVITWLGTTALLLLHPLFWQTLLSNDRYVIGLTGLDIVVTWLHNLFGFGVIGFLFMSPMVWLVGLMGSWWLWQAKSKTARQLLVFGWVAVCLEVLSVKVQTQRYLVAFLPFLVLPAAEVWYKLWLRSRWGKIGVSLAGVILISMSLSQSIWPEQFISGMSKITKYAPSEYLIGQTAGYGVKEVIQFIKMRTNSQETLVLVGFGVGNPENAISLYTHTSPNLYAMKIDAALFANKDSIQCLASSWPVFVVTRNDELLGLESFLTEVAAFSNPFGPYAVKVHTLKRNCNGETFSLDTVYAPAISRLKTFKNLPR